MGLTITTAAQRVAQLPPGTNINTPGLTNSQKAALRAVGDTETNANFLANGGVYGPNGRLPGGATGGMGMGANGRQNFVGSPAPSPTPNPLAGNQGMQTAVQPGQTVLQTGGGLSTGGLPQGQPNPAAVSGMAPNQSQNPSGAMPSYQPTGQATMGGQPMGFQTTQSSVPQTGLIGAESALESGLGAGIRAVGQGLDQGRSDVMGGLQGSNATLNPFMQAGSGANTYQADLSGANGAAAQQRAMDSFMSSPGQEYLLNESERAIRRNAAATGGLGGANVQRALQENAIGLAAQDFDNSFNRLGAISDRGLSASGQAAGNQFNAGNALAGLSANAANMNANMAYGTGNAMAAGRTRAGEMIAGNIQDTSSGLANINTQTGQNVAGAIGDGTSNLAQLLAGSGKDSLAAQQAYAALLAQISSGAGAQQAGLGSLGSTSQTEGMLGGAADLASGIGAFMALSDARLKKNVRKISEYNGANIYEWDWIDSAINAPTVGVIAQEHPDHCVTGDDGYLRVNLSAVLGA